MFIHSISTVRKQLAIYQQETVEITNRFVYLANMLTATNIVVLSC